MINDIRNFCIQQKIQGYILHTSDAFQNYSTIIEKLTKFSGSNAFVVVLLDKALFFTDGRYLEQAAKQIDQTIFNILPISDLKSLEWSKFIKKDHKIGYHPMLFTRSQIASFSNLHLVPIKYEQYINVKSSIIGEVFVYPESYAGKSTNAKLQALNKNVQQACYLITDTSSVSYILNLRSNAKDYRGMFNAYLTCCEEEIILFTDEKISGEVQVYLNSLKIKVMNISKIKDYVFSLEKKNFLVDLDTLPLELLNVIKSWRHEVSYKLSQACKTEQEVKNLKNVHIYDAVVFCEVLAWINQNAKKEISEFDITQKLIEERNKNPAYIKESFHAICGFQENSSIIHYKPSSCLSKKIKGSGILLIDTGGHYYGGTTDVTRTVCIGKPTDEQKLYYTLVLKGSINLSKSKFKLGVMGQNLDALARVFLWEKLVDYPHSTGHGVGNCLNVHEGPCGISLVNNVVLRPGMVLSNEPGFYKEGEFGIRIENLMYVAQADSPSFLEFQVLTLLPFCSTLIKWDILDDSEIGWIESYYEQIEKIVVPLLSPIAQAYIKNELNIFNDASHNIRNLRLKVTHRYKF